VKTYITVYFGTALVSMFLVPVVSRLAKRYHLVDAPGLRKIHKIPIPRIGGIVFVIATFTLVLPLFSLNNDVGRSFRAEQTKYIVLFICAFIMYVVGLIDDLHSVPPITKFVCLIGASLAICASGATIDSISVGSWFELELGWMSWPLAVIWITAIAVGINFLDGLDGLAGGVSVIVCGTIAILALWSDQSAMAVLMLALLGSVTGFLFFNFHPAKIFMGDGGAMFLGFIIGAGSIVCQTKTSTLVGIAVPLLVMGVPLLDAFFTVIRRRIIYRRSIFAAERGHLHHNLLNLGLPHQTVVIIIYAVTVVSASVGILMLTATGGWSLGLLVCGLMFLLAIFISLGGARIRETISAIKLNMAISREKKKENEYFQDSQLRMNEAMSFNAWWESMCIMAEKMQFHSMEFCVKNNGYPETKYHWKLSNDENQVNRTAEFILMLPENDSKMQSQMKVRIHEKSSQETICRQATLLGRLIDEFPPPWQESEKVVPLGDIQHEFDEKEKKAGPLMPVTKDRKTERLINNPLPINVMGVPIVPFESYSQALESIENIIESRKKSFWIAINPQKCYRAWQEPELMDILNQADVVFCDGIGMSLASKILNGQTLTRCTGCDLFFKTLFLATQKNWGVFLLGASTKSNSEACKKLKEKYPNLRIVGQQHGYFENSSLIIEHINASKADLLFVAMGSPKQEYWIWRNREAIEVPFCMGVGGTFDVASGNLMRAPKIFQKTGTEFLFQLITEPLKRWPRQKVYFPFMLKVIGKKFFGSAMQIEDRKDLIKNVDVSEQFHVKNMKDIFEQNKLYRDFSQENEIYYSKRKS
jgi:UDP-GlcNAc:undecaprenyl-phosphate GlcNAc-1-phosphate transferase